MIYTNNTLQNKRPNKRKVILIAGFGLLIIAAIVSSLYLIPKLQKSMAETVSIQTVKTLLTSRTYSSIKGMVVKDFLSNGLTEKDFDDSAQNFKDIADSNVVVLTSNKDNTGYVVLVSIASKGAEYAEGYHYAAELHVVKDGLINYKVDSLYTDYGREPLLNESN